jgi:hypothetical protein
MRKDVSFEKMVVKICPDTPMPGKKAMEDTYVFARVILKPVKEICFERLTNASCGVNLKRR